MCGHWDFAALDKHRMFGGYAQNAFICKDPKNRIPTKSKPCNINWLISFTYYLGSVSTSHDNIGPYAKIELMVMGLLSAAEISGEESVHCKNMDYEVCYQTKKYSVKCEEIISYSKRNRKFSLCLSKVKSDKQGDLT